MDLLARARDTLDKTDSLGFEGDELKETIEVVASQIGNTPAALRSTGSKQ